MSPLAEVAIAPDVVAAIQSLAADSVDGRETGGILFGRGPDKDRVIQIEQAGDAGPKAERRSDYFLRDIEHARTLADGAWARFKRIWVGEWHTHPHGHPAPSSLDLTTYASLLGSAQLEFEVFVSIIVIPGTDGTWQHPELWPWVLAIARDGEFRVSDDDHS